jgi:hypothetical protein
MLDAVAVAALLRWRPSRVGSSPLVPIATRRPNWQFSPRLVFRLSIVGAAWLTLAVPITWTIAGFAPLNAAGDLSALGQVFDGREGRSIVVLEVVLDEGIVTKVGYGGDRP